ncbi:hypothetical protein [Xanthomonas citri]|uniref:hypothetical protein n=1 Tax=Xanthomonas citri TaxID=346 RepID=UPI0028753CA4|nr:hypothetical protein [Xanthomonas citri]MDS0832487.1 hypothetical protein [Xanthomonas citri pv. punicae]MDS0836352.1 hypothetical protein [Xanthomonas citri pv. punicae]
MVAETTSGERVRRIVTGLIRSMPLVLGVATTACAHSSSGTPTTPPKEPAAMNAPTADAYRPHTLDEFPELTPEEIGRRFLKLIDSLKTSSDLTLEHIQEVMRLRLTPTPETHGCFFTIHLPESGWYYGVSYYDNPAMHRKNASYSFINEARDQVREKGLPDMAPVCGLDFNAYVMELKQMGFVEREDFAQYDSPMPPAIYDPKTGKETFQERRFFRLPGYYFSRGDFSVLIRERREADAPDDKLHHACVEFISVGGG